MLQIIAHGGDRRRAPPPRHPAHHESKKEPRADQVNSGHFYYDPLFLEHETGRHPENAGRISALGSRVDDLVAQYRCTRGSWEPLSASDLTAVHDAAYVETVQRVAERGGGMLDPDTVVSPRSYEVARSAAGAVASAVDNVLAGEARRAFCLLRPPGHHALRDRGMGFCLFNNIAIGARRAIDKHGLARVLVVDWDVHHGNGTQELFWEDPQVGFFSIHRYPFYPGTGAADETGGGAGLGTKLNVPVAYGTSRREYLDLFRGGLESLAEKMRPELILLSAGFDAHRLDPIGSLGLESEDFVTLTQSVVQIADSYSGGKIVSVLEGGYNPAAVAQSVQLHLEQLFLD
ncbi:MAG TPA: histone deacetylase [Pirellulaceae bacterium]|nr:histone deacetylase [Pirellulaceae bacterium]